MQFINCDFCGSYDHASVHCYAIASSSPSPHLEQFNAFSSFPAQEFDPFSYTYNSGWEQHPDFSWGGDQPYGQEQSQFGISYGQYGQSQYQDPPPYDLPQFQEPYGFNPQFQNPPQAPPQKSNLESLMETFVAIQTERNDYFEESLELLHTHNKVIELQIAQLATSLEENNKTQLPNQGQEPKENVNAIVASDGKVLSEVVQPEKEEGELSEILSQNDQDQGEEKQEEPEKRGGSLNREPSEPTKTTLQLADRSMKVPVGELFDVPVRVEKFHIPEDFFVLDMKEDVNTPIIVGGFFMATGRAEVDMERGSFMFQVGKKKMEFKLPHLFNYLWPTDRDASS